MKYDESLIIGLRLDSICLSAASVSLQVSGKIGDVYYQYSMSTMFELCFDKSSIFKDDITHGEHTKKIWDYLDSKIADISLSDDGRVLKISFENKKNIYIWSVDIDHDNLIVVSSQNSDDWFAIG